MNIFHIYYTIYAQKLSRRYVGYIWQLENLYRLTK